MQVSHLLAQQLGTTTGRLLAGSRTPQQRFAHLNRCSAISRMDGPSTPSSSYQAAAAALDAAQATRQQQLPAAAWQRRLTGEQTPTTSMPAAPAEEVLAAGTDQRIHTAFCAFFCYLGLMTAAATNSDWYLDAVFFGSLWAVLWAACIKLQPSLNTVALLCLLPVMHLTGALGLYRWELGNLSYDVLVHITNGFIGTLLFASVLSDMAAAAAPASATAATGSTQGKEEVGAAATGQQGDMRAAAAAGPQLWQERVWGVLKVTGLLLLSTTLIEVLEAAGGQLAGHAGEGIFLRGPGDMCTASFPCSEEVDTAKDMCDNVAGMCLALLGLATRGGSSSSSPRLTAAIVKPAVGNNSNNSNNNGQAF